MKSNQLGAPKDENKTKNELKKMNSNDLFVYIRENIQKAMNKSDNKKTGIKG